MEHSKDRREISANGIEFERGSVYERLGKLTDLRGGNGKGYRLETVLMLVGKRPLSQWRSGRSNGKRS